LYDTHERTHEPWFTDDPRTMAAHGPAARSAEGRGAREPRPEWPRTGTSVPGAPDAPQPGAPGDDGAESGRIWAGGWRPHLPRRSLSARIEQRSLFGEILDWMFAPLLLLWPLSVAMTFLVARSLADAPYDRALVDRTEAFAQQVRAASDRTVVVPPRTARDLLSADQDDAVYFQIVGPLGRIRAGEPDLPPPGVYDFPQPGQVKLRTAILRGDQVRVGYVYIDAFEGDGIAPILVQVAETLDRRVRLANEIIKGVIFPQFMILPVAVMLVWFGLARGLAPLKSLQQRIRERDPDDLSPIDPRGAPEEIAPLVDSFNDLLERLGERVDAQKRFIADAAHQMKTPLAGLRTQTELALRERDPDELHRNLEQIARGSQRAAHLISQLLALARTENQRDAATLERVDLQRLAREVVSDWVPAAIERGIDLGFETVEAPRPRGRPAARASIAGHPILLRELLNNLIDNALRYTPREGAVTVRVVRDVRAVHLEIEDTGPGIPEIEREMVFERFYRVLGTDVDGSGLGLSIVREIADQHGARIVVETAQPGQSAPGARFIVTFAAADLPVRPPAP
jgi:two-component system sensor histidine kinase TctE